MNTSDPLRMARMGLALIKKLPPRNSGGHAVLITSAAAGEGKTFVTDLLARTLAPSATGDTAVVSACLPGNAAPEIASDTGFTTLMATGVLGPSAVMATGTSQLFLVPHGKADPMISLFQPAGVERALIELRSRFRLSFIDGPVLAECGALLHQVDLVLLVVDARATSPRVIRRALDRASIRPADVDAAILNHAAGGLPAWLGGE
ncbi:hypothetical protein ABIC89_002604 [Variovorax boronicumulans]|uniref:hypothetical protein n=1 Tax=Variovorax boronicumulans TaxID=436515 RepID=UPI003394F8A1